jgi:hypothetical protein
VLRAGIDIRDIGSLSISDIARPPIASTKLPLLAAQNEEYDNGT